MKDIQTRLRIWKIHWCYWKNIVFIYFIYTLYICIYMIPFQNVRVAWKYLWVHKFWFIYIYWHELKKFYLHTHLSSITIFHSSQIIFSIDESMLETSIVYFKVFDFHEIFSTSSARRHFICFFQNRHISLYLKESKILMRYF